MSVTLLPRSYLFAPGHKPALFAKAVASGADAVVLDLEDAVPASSKDDARSAIADWLVQGSPVVVRINDLTTPWAEADLHLCRHPKVAAVLVPKVDDAQTLERIAKAVDGRVPLLPMIESARGLHHALAIASVPGVQRLVFGSLDFQADLGIPDDDRGLQHCRSQLVFVSRVAGIGAPVDGVTRRFDELAPVTSDAARARALGFAAKLCIHPKQVEVVNAAFSPSVEEVAWARAVVDADAAAQGGVTAVGDGMIDRPVMLRARAILERASRHPGP